MRLGRRWWLAAAAAAGLVAAAAALLLGGRWAPAVVATQPAGDLSVTIEVDRLEVGTRSVVASVRGADGRPAKVDDLRLRFVMEAMDMGIVTVDADPDGAGRFRASGPFFSMAGPWRIDAVVRRAGLPDAEARFELAVPPPGEVAGPSNPLQADAATLTAGRALFVASCAQCHGQAGRGDGPAGAALSPRPADLAAHMAPGQHTDGQVFTWIRQGVPGSAMPAFSQLSDEQVWQLVTYLRSLARSAARTAGPAPTAEPDRPPTVAEPMPPLVFPLGGNVWAGGADGQAAQLTDLTPGSYAKYPAVSPDGRRLAFVVFLPPAAAGANPQAGSVLYLAARDGSGAREVWRPARGFVRSPAWSADGASLFVALSGAGDPAADGTPSLQVARLDLAGGKAEVVAERALDPAVSPDGALLAFVELQPGGGTMALAVSAPDGGARRTLVDGAQFQGMLSPRFTPDGRTLIFAAVGGPPTDSRGRPAGTGEVDDSGGALAGLLRLLDAPAAEAHGAPYDLWAVGVDGRGLRRLTRVAEDEPGIAISPDGRQVAFTGSRGIYLMDIDGSRLRALSGSAADHGGIVWPAPAP